MEFPQVSSTTPHLDAENPFATMMASFDEAARLASIAPGEYRILRQPDRELAVSVPVTLDDGSVEVLEGWRVQHNAGLGPYFGPLRLDPGLKTGLFFYCEACVFMEPVEIQVFTIGKRA